jgi:radical SAM superfamily enzyme
LIFGLPGDSFEDMMASVALINELGVSMVKFHHLHIVRGTLMQKQYEAGEIKVLSEEEYIEILAEAVGRLKKDTVVARTVGDAGDDSLIAPRWETDKNQFEKRLADYMQARGISQGSLLDL